MKPPRILGRVGIAIAAIVIALPSAAGTAQADPAVPEPTPCAPSALDASALSLDMTTGTGSTVTSYQGGQSYLAQLTGQVSPACDGDYIDVTVPASFKVTSGRSYPIHASDGRTEVATMSVTTTDGIATARITFNQTSADMAATSELTLRAFLQASLDTSTAPGQVVEAVWDVNGVRTPISVNVTQCATCASLPASLAMWQYPDAGNQSGAESLRVHAVSQHPTVGEAAARTSTTSTFTITNTLEAGSGQEHDCTTPLRWSWYTTKDQHGNPTDLTSGNAGDDTSEIIDLTETSCSATARSYTATVTTPDGPDGGYSPVATRVRFPITVDSLTGTYTSSLTGSQDDTLLPSRQASTRGSGSGGTLIGDAVTVSVQDSGGNDADTAQDAADLTRTNGGTQLTVTVRNTGDEQLQNVRISGSVDEGGATVSELDCSFPDGSTGAVWSGPFKPGAEFTCTAELSGVTAESAHASTTTVRAVGVLSGHEVNAEDSYHAKVTRT
ncbi:hypothetical protein [Propionibacterium australiense]|uniref:hypothetical protein n=1 Tax=Propionibacterium australiense TaxID=119981 RepID=UPI0011C489D4|nr:hypothetical protein [Propionibacterium australiense]